MTTAAAVPTKQRKRGPKPRVKKGVRNTSYLPEVDNDDLIAIGGGNFSHGIRVALMVFREKHGTDVVPDLLMQVK